MHHVGIFSMTSSTERFVTVRCDWDTSLIDMSRMKTGKCEGNDWRLLCMCLTSITEIWCGARLSFSRRYGRRRHCLWCGTVKNDTYIEAFRTGSLYPSTSIYYLYTNLSGSIFQKTGIKICYFIKVATDFPFLGSDTVKYFVGF